MRPSGCKTCLEAHYSRKIGSFSIGNKIRGTAVLHSNSCRTAELTKVLDTTRRERFEEAVLPHLDAAYSLARWLTRNDQDAQDVTQEACLRAFRFFDGYQGGNMRSWMLTIVRNTCYTWLHQNRRGDSTELFNEEIHSPESSGGKDPEIQLLAGADKETLHRALQELPDAFREALVLREIEGMSYKEIADITSVSLGTVMSRLARARTRLRQTLSVSLGKES
jgi:RNA polymerase sigma factor (sigma-70 family)